MKDLETELREYVGKLKQCIAENKGKCGGEFGPRNKQQEICYMQVNALKVVARNLEEILNRKESK